MKVFAPSYYKKFNCIADKCNHSCCIGWEIDIDDDTLEYYKSIDGKIGKKLKESIIINDDYACFRLTDNDRCPFLNGKNLCELILECGEASLCQICSDHPRFKNFYGVRTEVGLGLACEEATRIIINHSAPFELIEIEYDNEASRFYDDEICFFNLRNEAFKIIECESNFNLIIERLLDKFNIQLPRKSICEWADIYLSLERLDECWSKMLNRLKNTIDIQFTNTDTHEKALKNLLTYFIYRHLGESVYDGNFNGRLLFAIVSCYMISALCKVGYHIEEAARMYSSEIEYSDENINNLIDLLQKESLED